MAEALRSLILGVALLAALTGCGRKGAPRPPERAAPASPTPTPSLTPTPPPTPTPPLTPSLPPSPPPPPTP